MRIYAASLIGRLVLASLMFPTASAIAEVSIIEAHQNKNESIIMISQGQIEPVKDDGRSKLSEEYLGIRTLKESAIEKANEQKLAHYKPRLESYVPPIGEMSILVTGYSSTPDQTWGDPFTTASGTHVHVGTMACPAQYPFGTKVKIESMGTYVCEDRGGKIYGNHFDMWFESRIQALNWGKKIVSAEFIK